MFSAAWVEARNRSARGDRDVWDPEHELVELVERAGLELQKLQALYDRRQGIIARRDAVAQLLNFVDGDITDVFRGFTASAACMLCSPNEWSDVADPMETEGELDLVVRYLDVGAMAAESPQIPDGIRGVFLDVRATLEGWGPRVLASIERIIEQNGDPFSDT